MLSENTSKDKLQKQKKLFRFSNLLTVAMLGFVIAMVVNPNVKATVIQGLMKVGLFQPSISTQNTEEGQSVIESNLPNVTFATANNETINLTDLKGKVVFINFWATWCPPCIAEMPSINKLYQQYQSNKNIVFLMVDTDGDFKKSGKFMSRRGYNMPLYIPASDIPEIMFGGSLPTTIVFNKKGQVVFQHVGSADYQNADFIKFMDSLP